MWMFGQLAGLTSPIWFMFFWAATGDWGWWPTYPGYGLALSITMFLIWIYTWGVAISCYQNLNHRYRGN